MDFGLFVFFLLVAFECGLKRVTSPSQDGTLSPFAFRFFQFWEVQPSVCVCRGEVRGVREGGPARSVEVCAGIIHEQENFKKSYHLFCS